MNTLTTPLPKSVLFLLSGALLVLMGCQDLSVENENSPNRAQVLAAPADVENLAGGTFLDFWTATQWCGQSPMLATMSDTYSCSWANWGMADMSSEPRIAWNNDPSYSRAGSVEFPWFDHYVTVSNAADVLNSIENQGDEAFTNAGVDPNRLRALVNFTMGLSYGYIGATFDRGFLVDETTDLEAVARGDVELELVPYTQVIDFAIAKLDKTIEVASNNSFQIPADKDWIFGLTLTNDDLVQLANSFKARFETWKARTPGEREGLRWGQVLTWIEQGMESDGYAGPFSVGPSLQDIPPGFAPVGDDQGTLEWDCTKWVGPQEGTWSRADYRMIGPADESGGYESWLDTPASQRNPFVTQTSDRRIQGDPDDPESDGSQYSYQGVAFTAFPVERGSYHYSDRTFERYDYYGNTLNGPMLILSKPEMDLLKAEALLHTGGDPGQIADLINNTRVDNGQLPPATASTPVGSVDDAPNPLAPGEVTLWSMLKYEFNMEVQMTGSGAVFFADRGWGDLVQGTPLHFPVPGQELETLDIQIYTFGGEGGDCSAGNATNCIGGGGSSGNAIVFDGAQQRTAQQKLNAGPPWSTK